jgi:hypothetical protein
MTFKRHKKSSSIKKGACNDRYHEFSISKTMPNIITNKMFLYAQVINAWLTGKITGIPFLRENSTGNPIKLQNV